MADAAQPSRCMRGAHDAIMGRALPVGGFVTRETLQAEVDRLGVINRVLADTVKRQAEHIQQLERQRMDACFDELRTVAVAEPRRMFVAAMDAFDAGGES